MEGGSHMINLDRVLKNNRVGIKFLRLKNFSASNLESSLEAIKSEENPPLIENRKRAILSFEYNKEKEDYYISAIVDVPSKINEIFIENGIPRIKETRIDLLKNIEVIFRLKTLMFIVFSQGVRETRRLSKYIRKITLGEFYPVPVKLDQNKVHNLVDEFEEITHLKVSRNIDNKVKFITFHGEDLVADELVSKVISDHSCKIYEIGGIIPLSLDDSVKFYLNHRGRISIWGSLQTLNINNLYKLIENIEEKVEYPEKTKNSMGEE